MQTEKKKESQREYYKKNKAEICSAASKWAKDNPDKHTKNSLDSLKRSNYKNEKTPQQREIRNIKRKTRYHFPLAGNSCKCGVLAQVRHHTTDPIKVDKFKFMCNPCHKAEHEVIKLGGKK